MCPGDNGKTYTAEDGTFFKVACQIHTIAADNPATELIRSTTAETLRECMEICSKEPTCLSIDHVNRPGGHRLKSCDLYKSGGGVTPTTPCGDSIALPEPLLLMFTDPQMQKPQIWRIPLIHPRKISLMRDPLCVAQNVRLPTVKLYVHSSRFVSQY